MEKEEVNKIKLKLKNWMDEKYPGAWKKFLNNIKNQPHGKALNKLIKNCYQEEIILFAFDWGMSPEQGDYWADISLDWRDECNLDRWRIK